MAQIALYGKPMEPIRYSAINGELLPTHEAGIPVSSRAVRFGDGVFETIRLTRGVPYQWEFHHARLMAGLSALAIPAPVGDLKSTIISLIQKNNVRDGFIRLAVYRGGESVGYKPVAAAAPLWVIEQLPAPTDPTAPYGLRLSNITKPSLRSLPVNHKLAQGVNNTLALLEAAENGCEEALLSNDRGIIAEAASANIFWIRGRELFTPSLDTGCLNGSTRATVMRLTPTPVHEIQQETEALRDADAVFITNTRLGVWPVSTIAPWDISFDTEHALIQTIQTKLAEDIDNYFHLKAVDWNSNS